MFSERERGSAASEETGGMRSETRCSSAQLALLIFTGASIHSDANLKTWPPNRAAAAKNLAVPPGFVCSAATLRCSQTEAEKVSGAGGWLQVCWLLPNTAAP